jgi:hypothetical protein
MRTNMLGRTRHTEWSRKKFGEKGRGSGGGGIQRWDQRGRVARTAPRTRQHAQLLLEPPLSLWVGRRRRTRTPAPPCRRPVTHWHVSPRRRRYTTSPACCPGYGPWPSRSPTRPACGTAPPACAPRLAPATASSTSTSGRTLYPPSRWGLGTTLPSHIGGIWLATHSRRVMVPRHAMTMSRRSTNTWIRSRSRKTQPTRAR